MSNPENRPSLPKHEVLLGEIKKELNGPNKSAMLAFSDYLELRDAEVQLYKKIDDQKEPGGGLGWNQSRRVQKAELIIDTNMKEDLVDYADSQTVISPLVARFIGTYRHSGVSLYKEGPFINQELAIDKLKALREEFKPEDRG
jgi:hypothetical protein